MTTIEEAHKMIDVYGKIASTESLYPLFMRLLKELEEVETLEKFYLKSGGKNGVKPLS